MSFSKVKYECILTNLKKNFVQPEQEGIEQHQVEQGEGAGTQEEEGNSIFVIQILNLLFKPLFDISLTWWTTLG